MAESLALQGVDAGSNPPGSTNIEEDAFRRLFLCLGFSDLVATTAFTVF